MLILFLGKIDSCEIQCPLLTCTIKKKKNIKNAGACSIYLDSVGCQVILMNTKILKIHSLLPERKPFNIIRIWLTQNHNLPGNSDTVITSFFSILQNEQQASQKAINSRKVFNMNSTLPENLLYFPAYFFLTCSIFLNI